LSIHLPFEPRGPTKVTRKERRATAARRRREGRSVDPLAASLRTGRGLWLALACALLVLAATLSLEWIRPVRPPGPHSAPAQTR